MASSNSQPPPETRGFRDAWMIGWIALAFALVAGVLYTFTRAHDLISDDPETLIFASCTLAAAVCGAWAITKWTWIFLIFLRRELRLKFSHKRVAVFLALVVGGSALTHHHLLYKIARYEGCGSVCGWAVDSGRRGVSAYFKTHSVDIKFFGDIQKRLTYGSWYLQHIHREDCDELKRRIADEGYSEEFCQKYIADCLIEAERRRSDFRPVCVEDLKTALKELPNVSVVDFVPGAKKLRTRTGDYRTKDLAIVRQGRCYLIHAGKLYLAWSIRLPYSYEVDCRDLEVVDFARGTCLSIRPANGDQCDCRFRHDSIFGSLSVCLLTIAGAWAVLLFPFCFITLADKEKVERLLANL